MIEGIVFTHDSTAGVVVIEQKGAGDKSTYRMLRSSAVKDLEVLAPPAVPSPSTAASWAGRAGESVAELPAIDLDAVNARYERAIKKVGLARSTARRSSPTHCASLQWSGDKVSSKPCPSPSLCRLAHLLPVGCALLRGSTQVSEVLSG